MMLVSSGFAQGESQVMCQEAFAKTIAVQQIEYLRRAYARATDQIGLADEASVEAGRAVPNHICQGCDLRSHRP